MKAITLTSKLCILLAISLPVLAHARDGQAQKDRDAQKAADQAILLEAFKGLDEELKAALADYSAAQQDARTRNLPREAWPKVPTPDFFPRFEELALLDQPDSLRWCLGTISMMGWTIDEMNARKDVYYDRIVHIHPNTPWIADIVRFLAAEASPTGLGAERVLPLLDFLVENSKVKGVPANALMTKAEIYRKSPKPEHAPLYKKMLEEVVAKYPQTDEGKRAKGLLFQTEYLALGKTAPDFKTTDVNGVEFKLSDYRGKVVVLDFWGTWCGPCVAMLPKAKEMVERLKNEPFALIGIDTDTSKDDFIRKAKELGVTWRNSWQGGTTGPLCVDWGVQKFPTIYVLDAKGVIRHTNVRGDDLSRAVDALLAEMRGDPAKKDTPPNEKAPEKKGN